MKQKISFLAIAVTMAALTSSCDNNPNNNYRNYNDYPQQQIGFDMQEFSNLVNSTGANPQYLEQVINTAGNNINNMDLDEDGNIDYLRVTENGVNIQVIDDIIPNNIQTLATISVTNTNNRPYVSIMGSPMYSGSNYHFTFADAVLLSYMLRPHTYYRSPYSYGHYPSYYSPRRTRSYKTTTVTTTSRKNSNNGSSSYNSSRNNSSSSYSSNNSYSNNRSSLSNPTKSQRSFEVRDNSQKVNASGFGSKSSSSSSYTPRSSYGSGSSSFGSKSSSSSSYTPRSSYGSSSSSFGSKSSSSSLGSSRSSFGSSRSSSFGKKK